MAQGMKRYTIIKEPELPKYPTSEKICQLIDHGKKILAVLEDTKKLVLNVYDFLDRYGLYYDCEMLCQIKDCHNVASCGNSILDILKD